MLNEEYTAVPLDEKEYYGTPFPPLKNAPVSILLKAILLLFIISICSFTIGFGVGQNWNGRPSYGYLRKGKEGLLDPQEFVPEIPMKEVQFQFPTAYQDTSTEGDELWNELMPLGSGFLRIPHPRRFNMPQSKSIANDPEEAEVYSLSVTHQLHCLGVLRDVIKKYEVRDKSRFAGEGHEYHCLDYLRQSVLCAGDTTLDFAGLVVGDDGSERRVGFSGEGSTHVCRDWDALAAWAIRHRSGDKVGIL